MDTKKQGGVNIKAFAIFAPYLLLRFYKFILQGANLCKSIFFVQ